MNYFLKILSGVYLAFIFLSFSSCKNDPAEVPAFIYINNINLNTNSFSQGAPTHKVTEIWVYADDQPIGVFDTNQLIPIIADDYSNIKLDLFAGIRSNGTKIDIQNYFIYKEISLNKSLIQGQIDTMQATFKYSNEATFAFIEGFENSNIFNKDLDGDSKTKISLSNESPLSENRSGKIILTKDNPYINVTSSSGYNLPKDGNTIYLELDYLSNIDFFVGISGKDINGNEHSQDIILIRERDSMNKIYINLTQEVYESGLSQYKIFFKAIHFENNDTSFIQLDNIKLIYLD